MRNSVSRFRTLRGSAPTRDYERAVLGIGSVVGFMLVWELSARLGLISTYFLGSPSGVIEAGIHEVQQARFWRDVGVSLVEFSVGYVLAAILGVAAGIVLGWYRYLSYLFEPLINFLYAVPRIALLPLIVLWLGLGIASKIAVVFLGAFMTILLSTYHGVRRADERYLAVARSFKAPPRRIFLSVVLPGSVPYVLSGLRLGIGRALIGVVVGELYAATAGLGYMISIAGNNLQVNRVLFGSFVLIALSFSSIELLRHVERRAVAWNRPVYQHG
jgi:NitT/TauT family transport system permease protein